MPRQLLAKILQISPPTPTPSFQSQSPLITPPMSTEFKPTHKKRPPPDAASSNPTPEGDHRKRRRNRTTQSCLNCHTSKRMCDRKRPCGRCTQLGLTGLCVYEVDDPSQRSGAIDESSRLRQRVAELEGVIRELKNKPHPRWAKSGSSPSEEFEKCHADTRSRSASEESAMESRSQSDLPNPLTNSGAGLKEMSPEKQAPCLAGGTLQLNYLSSSFSSPQSLAPLSTLGYSPYSGSAPSAPSTGIVTPTDEHPHMQVTVAGDQHPTDDIDLASLLMSYPDLLACDEGTSHIDSTPRANTHGQQFDLCSVKYNYAHFLDHCGCLNETASYNVVLELSLRLRKAADILGHSANHCFNNVGCQLNQKIADLDAFAATALGNTTTATNDFAFVPLRSRANTAPAGPITTAFSASSCVPPIRAPSISPPSFRGHRSWSGVSCTANPSISCDESFMTWEPSRQI